MPGIVETNLMILFLILRSSVFLDDGSDPDLHSGKANVIMMLIYNYMRNRNTIYSRFPENCMKLVLCIKLNIFLNKLVRILSNLCNIISLMHTRIFLVYSTVLFQRVRIDNITRTKHFHNFCNM